MRKKYFYWSHIFNSPLAKTQSMNKIDMKRSQKSNQNSNWDQIRNKLTLQDL